MIDAREYRFLGYIEYNTISGAESILKVQSMYHGDTG